MDAHADTMATLARLKIRLGQYRRARAELRPVVGAHQDSREAA